MPRCWIVNTTSMMIAPMMKVALIRTRQPLFEETKVDERDLPGVDRRIGRIENREEIPGREA
jgi:hypothetical protein